MATLASPPKSKRKARRVCQQRRAKFDAREADAEPTWDEERGFTVEDLQSAVEPGGSAPGLDLTASLDPSPERAMRFERPAPRRWAL